MPRGLKIFLTTVFGLVFFFAIVVGLYGIYLQAHYERIADNQIVRIEGTAAEQTALTTNHTYTVMTYNIGFGAYTPNFTFFMEAGTMEDGAATRGARGTATSEDSVRACTEGAIRTVSDIVGPAPSEEGGEETAPVEGTSPDFMLFQEVDTDSDRSFHIDQKQLIKDAFPTYTAYFAENFHSGFLAWPPTNMHGRANSGLLTLNDVAASSVIRRSYPIDESIPARFIDLDRCLCVMRIPVAGSSELVLINHHMSAYDEGGAVRAEQLSMLSAILTTEREAGNYVIVGGDWNHSLAGSSELYPSDQQVPGWAIPLDDAELPEGYHTVRADNIEEVATCRGSDIPYQKGHSYESTIDGFVVSDNVQARATNVDTGYAYSDHNPVLLHFELSDAATPEAEAPEAEAGAEAEQA